MTAASGAKRPASVAFSHPTPATKKRKSETKSFHDALCEGKLVSPEGRIALCRFGTTLVPANATFVCRVDDEYVCFALLDPRLFEEGWVWCRNKKATSGADLQLGTIIDGLLEEVDSVKQKGRKYHYRAHLKTLFLRQRSSTAAHKAPKKATFAEVAAWLYDLARAQPSANAPLDLDKVDTTAYPSMRADTTADNLLAMIDITDLLGWNPNLGPEPVDYGVGVDYAVPTPSPTASPLSPPDHHPTMSLDLDALGFAPEDEAGVRTALVVRHLPGYPSDLLPDSRVLDAMDEHQQIHSTRRAAPAQSNDFAGPEHVEPISQARQPEGDGLPLERHPLFEGVFAHSCCSSEGRARQPVALPHRSAQAAEPAPSVEVHSDGTLATDCDPFMVFQSDTFGTYRFT
mmetsp:Transcript_874/g.3219  ORF Transcript_874/g.3219 Transcript_874/m.3219 type:complete len:401 (-) Transcript_874:372-1574(-)|eukprot:CAMPEP_0114624344 /NCGR_PEP_ID=MMETSP0168-20121206/10719_1 /TAXON_ID=95228 ORGANISM="Vannella sp., Strain DIVA3 517/6/12" /NCGR_SAMPLE_ID=MMETSP0168 /ASSEMBLY_ACC=CAM_ASM_000044 /LENGTH=400 /DNA_ID=CAMNT_0001835617 /DNA_START=27 /DNA_END=1229 /DNA_ORIENTATION=-